MNSNLAIVKAAYAAAEGQLDPATFIALFAQDGYFRDMSSGKTYRGQEMGVAIHGMHASFPDIRREMGKIYPDGDVVIIELALKGTHTGPLETPNGTLPATGKMINVPCCDVWTLKNGKIVSFHCYNAAALLHKSACTATKPGACKLTA